MDVRFLLLLVCFCTLFFPSPGLILQRDSYGISVHARRPLSLGSRQVLTIKAQGDKEQPENKVHRHDTESTKVEKGSSAVTELVDDTGRGDSTGSKVKAGNKETDRISAPPPPPINREDWQPTLGKESDVNKTFSNVEKPDSQKKNDIAPLDKQPTAPVIQRGESQCEDPEKLVSACLRIPGDGAHKLLLLIKNSGDSEVVVKVVAPDYLTANPPEVSVSTGKSETIQLLLDSKFDSSMLDLEAVKNKSITVITSSGDCEIAVPLEYLRSSASERKPPVSSYLRSVTPRAVAYLGALVLVVAVMGTWLCYKCYRKKRGGDVKYQQLEMIVPGQITPKEREEQSPGAWDEDWDDDWEDAEAAKSSSRLSQNLSSRNLGARRANKDGWDNSWED